MKYLQSLAGSVPLARLWFAWELILAGMLRLAFGLGQEAPDLKPALTSGRAPHVESLALLPRSLSEAVHVMPRPRAPLPDRPAAYFRCRQADTRRCGRRSACSWALARRPC